MVPRWYFSLTLSHKESLLLCIPSIHGKILANNSQFTKILHNQKLPLKCFKYRSKVIHQLITAKTLVSIYILSRKFYPFNISPCVVNSLWLYGCCHFILLTPSRMLYAWWDNWYLGAIRYHSLQLLLVNLHCQLFLLYLAAPFFNSLYN